MHWNKSYFMQCIPFRAMWGMAQFFKKSWKKKQKCRLPQIAATGCHIFPQAWPLTSADDASLDLLATLVVQWHQLTFCEYPMPRRDLACHETHSLWPSFTQTNVCRFYETRWASSSCGWWSLPRSTSWSSTTGRLLSAAPRTSSFATCTPRRWGSLRLVLTCRLTKAHICCCPVATLSRFMRHAIRAHVLPDECKMNGQEVR